MNVGEPTVDIGGEDDGLFGVGGPGDVGPKPPWEAVHDLASLNSAQRQVRRVVDALRVLMNVRPHDVHRRSEVNEEHCSRAHYRLDTGGRYGEG